MYPDRALHSLGLSTRCEVTEIIPIGVERPKIPLLPRCDFAGLLNGNPAIEERGPRVLTAKDKQAESICSMSSACNCNPGESRHNRTTVTDESEGKRKGSHLGSFLLHLHS